MQASARHVTLFHCPNTRSTGALILLEELQAEYTLKVMNMKAGEHRAAEYLAINPMGKVPAVMHGASLVTEQVALFLYLADLYPEAGLAPGLTDPLRGPYLRWMVYYASCFEPAIVDRATKRAPAPVAMSPYGDYDAVVKLINDQLSGGPYLFGERLTAADILWGTALSWITQFGLIEATPAIRAYVDRIAARPAAVRARARDAELAASQAA